jgi:hypothetical protein
MAYVWFEEGELKERGQSKRRNMEERIQTNREASSRLQRGRLDREFSERRIGPFQGPPEFVMFLLRACFFPSGH